MPKLGIMNELSREHEITQTACMKCENITFEAHQAIAKKVEKQKKAVDKMSTASYNKKASSIRSST
ncbi:hypothetical protein [Sinanaerobacter sp. ZZT-01]|uniref:hypothetical protein n=1 Tax=Sinanaerobacter sp. ZZT-01 TaxID=3111540 RepID=UPI002D76784E|nr:hypothetical protein [Sinanaerobacter sp. ZZT-01]WRR92462.1 hypothetical protein U5921_10385 [Sinanaerobacter sp. ZZT-01]